MFDFIIVLGSFIDIVYSEVNVRLGVKVSRSVGDECCVRKERGGHPIRGPPIHIGLVQ